LRLALTIAGILVAVGAEAQPALYTGMLTPHIGASAGGDVRERAVTPGASMAVVDPIGIGAEVDLGHSRRVDADRFSESAVTSLMVNAVGMWMKTPVRPFVVAGAGLLRVRAAVTDGGLVTSRTDWGFNAGAGALYMVNELVGVRGDVRYFRYLQRHPDLPLLDNGFFDYWRTSVGVTLSWSIR
jgi:opacity protein-like surface antigen